MHHFLQKKLTFCFKVFMFSFNDEFFMSHGSKMCTKVIWAWVQILSVALQLTCPAVDQLMT